MRPLPPAVAVLLASLEGHPGDETGLLALADCLDEHNLADLAAATRDQAPGLARRHRRAIACLDAILAVEAETLRPVAMPLPDRGRYRSRRQIVGLVRRALRPLAVPGLTVAATAGWGAGAEVEIRLPPADCAVVADGGDGFPLPWSPTGRELLAAANDALRPAMSALFPGEPRRLVHADGDTFEVSFWRVAFRPRR